MYHIRCLSASVLFADGFEMYIFAHINDLTFLPNRLFYSCERNRGKQ